MKIVSLDIFLAIDQCHLIDFGMFEEHRSMVIFIVF